MTDIQKREAKKYYKREHNFRNEPIYRYFINPYNKQPYSTFGIKKAEEYLEYGFLEINKAVYEYFRLKQLKKNFF